MSERCEQPMFVHGVCRNCFTRHENEEPQEGAPPAGPSPNSSGAVIHADVPSCGSVDLAAIRERLEDSSPDGWSQHYCRILLRMVDELTHDREALGRKSTRIKDNLRAVERERDELRAKLTDQNLHIDGLNAEVHDLQEKQAGLDILLKSAGERMLDLEERWRQQTVFRNQEHERAEELEARVRELGEQASSCQNCGEKPCECTC